MKWMKLQLPVAAVCIILGFLITYQFRLISKEQNPEKNDDTINSKKISQQIDEIKKEIEDIDKKNEVLLGDIKKYEDMATDIGSSSKAVKDELDLTRMLLGTVDVQGPGIIITLQPKDTIFSSNDADTQITDEELIAIVRELDNRGAEAVSINGKRITSRSGIKSSSGNSYILVNDEKVSPIGKIEIKAIGSRTKFADMDNFAKKIQFNVYKGYTGSVGDAYDVDAEYSDSIDVAGYNKSLANQYAVPIK